jgi:hypothetical protein
MEKMKEFYNMDEFIVKTTENTPHGAASRAALQIYSRVIYDQDPNLGVTLYAWVYQQRKLLGVLETEEKQEKEIYKNILQFMR